MDAHANHTSGKNQFYLQDSRGNTGDNLMFWASEGGYTSDVQAAEVFTEERAFRQHHSREFDLPWPVPYIAQHLRPVVDMQTVRAAEAGAFAGSELFYKQHPDRTYVGNDILFLREDGVKYTTNLKRAKVFTRGEAFEGGGRNLDGIFWPKEYIDQKSRLAADCRKTKLKVALKDCKSVLLKPKRASVPRYRCDGCGKFMSAVSYYTADCGHCGCNNRP